MPLTAEQRAQVQATYMQRLLDKAREAVGKLQESQLAFDPQGRVLIDVELTSEDIDKIVQNINSIESMELITTENLAKALGRKYSDKTTVSLDVETLGLKDTFESALKRQLQLPEESSNQIIENLGKVPKGSIIALQQEFHFHLSLAACVYQKAVTAKFTGKEEKLDEAHRAAMLRVNGLVMAEFAKALKKASTGNTLDIARLNVELDKARKRITPRAHTILMQEIVQKTGVILSDEDLKQVKEVAEKTTATPNDILHVDSENGLVTWIEGSEHTAHHRERGKQFAHREMVAHAYRDDEVRPNPNPRLQIRTPSPVVKEGLTDEQYISDVGEKLAHITNTYNLKDRLSGGGSIGANKPKAFIYNRYTALNDRLGDIKGNLQTQSAKHILLGAHRYNKAQFDAHREDAVYCFVQGISVNGFGDALHYDSGDPLLEESTLMTEMALMHTLYDSAGEAQKQWIIHEVIGQYQAFLQDTSSGKPEYFSQSDQGRKAKKAIRIIKSQWKAEKEHPKTDNVVAANAKHALKQMVVNDLHFNHDYSKLIQSLSVFSEEASIGGCKSGNERAQSINGRVAIFDQLASGKKSSELQSLRNLLQEVANADSNQIQAKAGQLKSALDEAYNAYGLQAASSLVSLVDQGASAKVEAKPRGLYISRNYAEEKASTMTHLHQTKAGKMQAHKGLSAQMKSAWEGHPKSWWSRMKSSPLGIIGAIIGVMTVLPALIVAGYSAWDNKHRKLTTKNSNIQLQSNYGEPWEGQESKNLKPLILVYLMVRGARFLKRWGLGILAYNPAG